MIYFDSFFKIFHHCYKFNLIILFFPIIKIMLYKDDVTPKIDDYLEIWTDEEVKIL